MASASSESCRVTRRRSIKPKQSQAAIRSNSHRWTRRTESSPSEPASAAEDRMSLRNSSRLRTSATRFDSVSRLRYSGRRSSSSVRNWLLTNSRTRISTARGRLDRNSSQVCGSSQCCRHRRKLRSEVSGAAVWDIVPSNDASSSWDSPSAAPASKPRQSDSAADGFAKPISPNAAVTSESSPAPPSRSHPAVSRNISQLLAARAWADTVCWVLNA